MADAKVVRLHSPEVVFINLARSIGWDRAIEILQEEIAKEQKRCQKPCMIPFIIKQIPSMKPKPRGIR